VEKDDGHRTHVVIVGVDFDVLEHVIRESRSLQNKRKDRNQFELQQSTFFAIQNSRCFLCQAERKTRETWELVSMIELA